MELKRLWKEYKAAAAVSDELDARWDAGEDVETEWDAAYKIEHEAFEKVVEEIANLIKIEKKTARTLILSKEEMIENLLNRVA